MELQIKLNDKELKNLVDNGVLFKVLEANTFGDKNEKTGMLNGQVSYDLSKPEEPTPVVPVTSSEVNITGAVPTSEKSYSIDELSLAAAGLMDRGMMAQLQEMLAGFNVISLAELPKDRYGECARCLRELGAEI